MDRIQDIRAFEEVIYDALNELIENRDQFPLDAVLRIDSQSMDVSIDSPIEGDCIDNISLFKLIDENEIDCDMVNELACKYFFVR